MREDWGGEGAVTYKWIRSQLASKISKITVNAKRKWINVFEV